MTKEPGRNKWVGIFSLDGEKLCTKAKEVFIKEMVPLFVQKILNMLTSRKK